MIDSVPDASTVLFGGTAGLVGIVFLVRFLRRMFYGEKRDTGIDLASQGLFDNLRLENTRMSLQMTLMSEQLRALVNENYELNNRITELTISVRKLVTLEHENTLLQEKLLVRDKEIILMEEAHIIMSEDLKRALEVVRMRTEDRSLT